MWECSPYGKDLLYFGKDIVALGLLFYNRTGSYQYRVRSLDNGSGANMTISRQPKNVLIDKAAHYNAVVLEGLLPIHTETRAAGTQNPTDRFASTQQSSALEVSSKKY